MPPFPHTAFLILLFFTLPFSSATLSHTTLSRTALFKNGQQRVYRCCPSLLYRPPPLRPDNGGFTAAQQTTYAKALLLLRKFSPLWGRPPPRSGGGRPQRGGMDDGRTFICRNLTTKWLSRTTLVLTRRGAAAMCAAGEAKRRKIQKPTNKTVLF